MSREKDIAALQEVLPPGIVLTEFLRAEPRLRAVLVQRLLLGVLLILILRRPRATAVGISDQALCLMPLPRPRPDPRLVVIPRHEIVRVTVKPGALRTKITIETQSTQYHLRVPRLASGGPVKEALNTLASLGGAGAETTQPIVTNAGWSTGPVAEQWPPPSSSPAGRQGAPARFRLLVTTGDYSGRSFPLGELTTIGRNAANDIVLPDRSVSGFHAQLECTPGGQCILTDKGSSNGTLVNGQEIAGSIELRGNDVLELGMVSLRFEQRA